MAKPLPPNTSLYTLFPIPNGPWHDLSMDSMLGFPKTLSRFDSICIVVDWFSKMAHFIPCAKTFDDSHIASLFIKELVRQCGLTLTIVSEKDSRFVGHF